MLVRVLSLHRDQKSLARTGERWKISESHRILCMEGSGEHSRCQCVHKPSRSPNNFKHKVLRIEPIGSAVQRCVSRSTEFASR